MKDGRLTPWVKASLPIGALAVGLAVYAGLRGGTNTAVGAPVPLSRPIKVAAICCVPIIPPPVEGPRTRCEVNMTPAQCDSAGGRIARNCGLCNPQVVSDPDSELEEAETPTGCDVLSNN